MAEQVMLELANILEEPPLAIEVLPGDIQQWLQQSPDPMQSTPHYLYEERNLGIPQKVLYRSYMVAVKSFQNSRRLPEELITIADLIASSSVILLANPAHQTALNVRKRLVIEKMLDPGRELAFMTSLLTLRECAKQSIIWDHRRWLLQRISNHPRHELTGSITNEHPSDDMALHISLDLAGKEFDVIYRACGRYPRNYYAWTHWQVCARSIASSASSKGITLEERGHAVQFLLSELQRLRTWIEIHISDHSAVHHLCIFIEWLRNEGKFHRQIGAILTAFNLHSYFAHALSLLEFYPSHETLWLYLRYAIFLHEDPDVREEWISRVCSDATLESPRRDALSSWFATKV